jgi:hypothetical protein
LLNEEAERVVVRRWDGAFSGGGLDGDHALSRLGYWVGSRPAAVGAQPAGRSYFEARLCATAPATTLPADESEADDPAADQRQHEE